MLRSLYLILLIVFCFNEKSNALTTPAVKYPQCDNKILFGFENSNKVNDVVFKKQINFLASFVFEEWNNFGQLGFITYANPDYQIFGSLKTKEAVIDFVNQTQQIDPVEDLCFSFYKISQRISLENVRIILFVNEFTLSDIKLITRNSNTIAFVPLSDKFDSNVLKRYFKQAKVIEWDIKNDEVPTDWEKQFNDFYDCEDVKTTTIETTTEDPNNRYPPCNFDKIVIAFDKSTGFSSQEYLQIQDFLTNHAFENWTSLNQVEIYSFADHIYSTVDSFKNINDLTDFIQNEEQIDAVPDFCNFFYTIFYYSEDFDYSEDSDYHVVIFLSGFNTTDFETTRKILEYNTCKDLITGRFDTKLTFVVLNDEMDTGSLQMRIPQTQFIRFSNLSTNWQWQILTAYNCNQDDYNNTKSYPCDSKFIFAYEVSSKMNKHVLDVQRYFLREHVFNKDWNVFSNLALVAYSNETIIRDFGTLKNLNEVHDFIDKSFKQNTNAPASLCNTFKQLTTMYLFEVNIVMFVDEFHEGIGDECTVWIKQLRENLNTINFVMLSQKTNTEYLVSKFPQAIFTGWDITTNRIPNNWNLESYGCQDFVFTGNKYPCNYEYISSITVIYDKSHYLSPVEYQRLQYFILTKVFIKQWADATGVQSEKEPLICSLMDEIKSLKDSKYWLFFVSKFDESVFNPDKNCSQIIHDINENHEIITFFKLSSLVNDSFLWEVFRNATIIEWNIEQDKEPAHWNEILWTAFGCTGESPIVLPKTTSTFKSTTRALTTVPVTVKRTSTDLTSSITQTTTQISTTTIYSTQPITATTHSSPNIALIVVPSVLVFIILLILTASVISFCWYRKRKRDQMVDNIVSVATSKKDNNYNGRRIDEDLWRIETERVEYFVDKKLGSGVSASVYLGKLTGISGISLVYPNVIALRHFHDCDVAVKVLPFYATDLNRDDFKQEINFMKKLNCKYHPHIICFLGYTSDQIVLEYCANGDLMHFLKKSKDTFNVENESSLKLKDLIGFAWQVANGMEFFASLELVHRDLAARNILLTKEKICKISDFGLARTDDVNTYTSKRRMPVRWLPPEALKSFEYSTKTDVWSYGVLLHEIFTLGEFPYSELENSEILNHIEGGSRLEQPEHAPDQIYNLMTSCWSTVPDERPTFTEICHKLTPLLELFNITYNYISPIETIVEENPKTTSITPYPSCDDTLFIVAFDKSNGFTEDEYKQEQDFLIDYVFRNWTRFKNLIVYSFADTKKRNLFQFRNKAEIESFIRATKRIDKSPDFCTIIFGDTSFAVEKEEEGRTLIFLKFEKINPNWEQSCKEYLYGDSFYIITFVLLNNAVDTDVLRDNIPQARFIRLDLPDTPKNLEWQFNTAYGCNENDYNDQSVYPCNSKFIFAYDVSSNLNTQRKFLIENVFNNDWSVFENLALIAYSNETIVKDFGIMSNLSDVHDFIEMSFKQSSTESVSLCSVFKQLTKMYIFNVNVILFVNEFHQFGDECVVWIKQLRENINTINFVLLTKQVSTEYLASKFPQATFTSWDITTNNPTNWDISSFGCQDFIVNATEYPCFSEDDRAIVYEKSHYLNPIAYQKLISFLLKNVFIKQWSYTGDVEVYTYPDDGYFFGLNQSIKSPLICPTLITLSTKGLSTLLFFMYKFDETVFVLDGYCSKSVQNINEKIRKITVVKLGPLVNETFLLKIFPAAKVVDWDIEKDRVPSRWNQMLWEALNCYADSPILLPTTTSTSTSKSTTKALITTTTQITSTIALTSTIETKPVSTSKTTYSFTHKTHATDLPPNTSNIVPIVAGTFVPLFVIALIASVTCFCWYRKKKRNQIIGNMAFDATCKTSNVHITQRNDGDLWKLNAENVTFFANRKLGSGASAEVYLGKIVGDAGIKRVYPTMISLQDFHDCRVAIKVLPIYATESDKNDFKQEINFMKNLKYHQHVACLLGYTNNQIIIEYCANGDLMNFLRRNKATFEKEEGLKLKDLISFSWQVATGMEYFSSLSLVHRDLAARNVLLTADLVCKISDFGLARESNLQSYISKKRMPIRWLPPETLRLFEYSTKTDVWSYGVLLYEIFTLGNLPYSNLDNLEILSHIDSGNRLEKPEHASDDIYDLMTTCWNSIADERPTFTEICQQLIPQLEQFNINYNYISPVESVVVEETNELAVFDDYFSDNDCVV